MPASPARDAVPAYEFGPFRLDLRSRELRNDGRPRPLTPKAFETLLLLVEARGRALSKGELMAALWPGAHVEEATLAQHVFILRRALGDDAESPRYIATVPRHGYRFVADVVVRPATADAPDPSRRRPRVAVSLLALAGALLAAASAVRSPGGPGAVLLVLPFASGGGEEQYVAEGLTEGLIDQASRVVGLRVLARHTAFRHRDSVREPRSIARDLRADLVLGGRARLEGARVTVEAQLTEVATGAALWTGRFARPVAELPELQRALARDALSRVPALAAPPPGRAARVPDAETYTLYLKARFFWNKRTAADLTRSIGLFRQALARDPLFAPALAGLADAYNVLPEYSPFPEAAAYPAAREAALGALALDDSLAEAHGSLAFVLFWWDHDWPGARREFERSLSLNPGYGTAHHWYGNALLAMDRLDEGVAQLQEAHAADPLSQAIGAELGAALYLARRYDEAVAQLRRTLELDDRFAMAHFWLGRALLMRGQPDEAVGEYQRARELVGTPVSMLAELGYAAAVSGRSAEARARIDELATRRGAHPVAYSLAIVHAGLGERDAALAALERAAEERSSDLAFIGSDPVFDGIRADARFAALRARLRGPRAGGRGPGAQSAGVVPR
jgi:DNA-binding winged helix-turn-helix (wHTH) protein/TolB-like protein/Tfp pilus assembly protein PilF